MIRLPKLKLSRKKLGDSGENLAAKHLRSQGYAIIERNYRLKAGELDLIARKGSTLVFVEVKTRRSDRYGPPETAVTRTKQRRIVRLAEMYMKQKKLLHLQPRFDVIAIQWKETGGHEINHIQAAFIARP